MSEALQLNKRSDTVVLHIHVDIIRPNPYQPRQMFDKTSIAELAESIKEYGVISPISVRPAHGSTYELVAGERRLKAAKLAGLTYIPAIITDFGESDSAVVALLENLQRKDLSFLEEAQSYFHLINHHGLSQEEISKKVGKSQSAISNKLRILKLGPMVKKMLTDNELTERHARAILRLPDEQTQLRVLKQICDKGYNVRRTEEIVEQVLSKMFNECDNKKAKKSGFAGISDIKIFINTLKQTVKLINDAGLKAAISQKESENFIEYTIRVEK